MRNYVTACCPVNPSPVGFFLSLLVLLLSPLNLPQLLLLLLLLLPIDDTQKTLNSPFVQLTNT